LLKLFLFELAVSLAPVPVSLAVALQFLPIERKFHGVLEFRRSAVHLCVAGLRLADVLLFDPNNSIFTKEKHGYGVRWPFGITHFIGVPHREILVLAGLSCPHDSPTGFAFAFRSVICNLGRIRSL
jgi:hypothetical protein